MGVTFNKDRLDLLNCLLVHCKVYKACREFVALFDSLNEHADFIMLANCLVVVYLRHSIFFGIESSALYPVALKLQKRMPSFFR